MDQWTSLLSQCPVAILRDSFLTEEPDESMIQDEQDEQEVEQYLQQWTRESLLASLQDALNHESSLFSLLNQIPSDDDVTTPQTGDVGVRALVGVLHRLCHHAKSVSAGLTAARLLLQLRLVPGAAAYGHVLQSPVIWHDVFRLALMAPGLVMDYLNGVKSQKNNGEEEQDDQDDQDDEDPLFHSNHHEEERVVDPVKVMEELHLLMNVLVDGWLKKWSLVQVGGTEDVRQLVVQLLVEMVQLPVLMDGVVDSLSLMADEQVTHENNVKSGSTNGNTAKSGLNHGNNVNSGLNHENNVRDSVMGVQRAALEGLKAITLFQGTLSEKQKQRQKNKRMNVFGEDVEGVIKEWMRLLVPVIVCRPAQTMQQGPAVASIPKVVQGVSDTVVSFIVELLDTVRHQSAESDGDAEESVQRVLGRCAYILCQQVVARVIDKAEYRQRVVVAVCQLMEALVCDGDRVRFVRWLMLVGRSCPKVHLRSVVCDVLAGIWMRCLDGRMCLVVDDVDQGEDQDGERDLDLSRLSIVQSSRGMRDVVEALVRRCEDKAPAVRARALAALSDVMGVTFGGVRPVDEDGVPNQSLNGDEAGRILMDVFDQFVSVAMVRARLRDEKSTVRKAAIGFCGALLAVDFAMMEGHGAALVDANIKVGIAKRVPVLVRLLEDRCRDVVMTLRRLVIQTVTALVRRFPGQPLLWKCWENTLIMSDGDTEIAVQDECGVSLQRVLIDCLANHDEEYFAYVYKHVLPMSKQIERAMASICKALVRREAIPGAAVKFVSGKALAKPGDRALWSLLAVLVPFSHAGLSVDQLLTCWGSMGASSAEAVQSPAAVFVLDILTSLVKPGNKAKFSDMGRSLVESIGKFEVAVDKLPAVIELAGKVVGADDEWYVSVMHRSERALNDHLAKLGKASFHGWEMVNRILFTLGEIALVCPKHANETVMTPVLALLSSGSEQVPASTRAQAFLTLGKFCLLNEKWAKAHMSLFAHELETSKDYSIRNNIVMILSDLCRRYTRVVDLYIPVMANCMADSNKVVRMQSLMMLTKLLQEDYIKWKGSLLLKFLFACVDQDRSISELARESLRQLSVKTPTMFFVCFIDALHFFNDYPTARLASISATVPVERQLFSLSADESRRRQIFIYLLKMLADDQRFQLTRKLCLDVLKQALDGHINFTTDTGSALLIDTFYILSSKDIKSSIRVHKPDANEAEEDVVEPNQSKIAQLSSKIHSQIARKIAIETIIPIVIDLKRMLEQQRSPLLKHLMGYLRELVRDYRVEMEDIMVSDRQLAQEIEFDLRQFEKQQKEERQRQEEARRASAVCPSSASRAAANRADGFKTPLPPKITTPKAGQTPTGTGFSVPRIRNSDTKRDTEEESQDNSFQFAVPLPPSSSKRRVTFADNTVADNRRDSFGQQLPAVPNVLSTPRRSSLRNPASVPSTPNNGPDAQQRSWNIQSPAVQKPTPKSTGTKRVLPDENDENLVDDEAVFGSWA